MEMKLTIDQLKNYLGTGLKFETSKGDLCSVIGVEKYKKDDYEVVYFYNHSAQSRGFYGIEHIPPHCYRLSDLDKFIPELGFVPIDELEDLHKINSMWYGWSEFMRSGNLKMIDFPMASQLFQWHFWPFGDEYFEAGLVIDKLKHGV